MTVGPSWVFRVGRIPDTETPDTDTPDTETVGMRELPERPAQDLDLASVMHALADPSRLRMVESLVDVPELSCAEVGGRSGSDELAKSTRSHHLRVLREAGVVSTRYDGPRKLVSLRRDDLDARFPGLVQAVVAGVRSAG